jgi:DNA-binding MarR family transcriptional regulator
MAEKRVPDEGKKPASPSRALRSHGGQSPLQKLKSLLLPASRMGVSEDHILSILAARRGREAALGRELFSDPAWDVLLELYAAKLGGRRMTTVDLARAIDMPESTTARWITALAERGLVVSSGDPEEQGSLSIRLTPAALSEMKHLLDYWEAAFRSI